MQHIDKPGDGGCLIWRENNEILAGMAKDCGGKRYDQLLANRLSPNFHRWKIQF
jgi:hypothetical protein